MKVGLYWENGYFQAVLTPENEHEKRVCDLIEKKDLVQVKRGGFYHCMGGWLRQNPSSASEESIMLILEDKQPSCE